MSTPTGHLGPRSDLHKHLQEWRRRADLTLEQMASMLTNADGRVRSTSSIHRWEQGTRRVDLDVLAEIAALFGVKAGLLLDRPPADWTWKSKGKALKGRGAS